MLPALKYNSGSGPHFSARPIRQWRKQYSSTSIAGTGTGTSTGTEGNSNASVGMPMDRPGGLTHNTVLCTTCKGAIKFKDEPLQENSPCKSCNPIKANTQLSETMYNDTKAYLTSRCAIYDQQLSTIPKPEGIYFLPSGVAAEPSNSPTGSQIRDPTNCLTHKCETVIYKPNNVQYAQQGGVSSSSRIARLKYNNLNQNGAAYNSAAGAVGINSGRYQTEASPSYYNKYKPQKVNYPYKVGTKSYCKTEYSLCANE